MRISPVEHFFFNRASNELAGEFSFEGRLIKSGELFGVGDNPCL